MSTMPFNDVAARRMARLAGLSYVLYSAAGIYITFGPIPSLSALGDENASPLLALMFRTGFLAEVVLYTFVCVSAAAMYMVLKSVGQGPALVAAFCRLIEGAMGATFIIFKYAVFITVVNPELTPGFSDDQRASLVSLLRDVYGSAIYFLLIPMAVGGVLFFSLFFRSRFIPRWLSAWGIFTYLVIGSVAATVILYPALEEKIMLFFLPGALFEWVAAFWLLFAGINTKHWMARSS
ncbi:DUF4386 domain-containing protein [Parvularcula marina]|uniref:DUF4386 domain-containing protein n=1 Tax=Parvularcula marina TaxID=2292771 RepID=A0A371RIG5_9PROT|nr:DUF4386 domain-containing protein [Parvularcula marina]RFB05247.1 DUF4386 domain-containing protein [Parvularcula marina]